MDLRLKIFSYTITISCTFIFVQIIMFYISLDNETIVDLKRQHRLGNYINVNKYRTTDTKLSSIFQEPNESLIYMVKSVPLTWPDISKVNMDKMIQYHMSGSEFHKSWDVNCTKIINGEQPYVQSVFIMLNHYRDNEDKLSIPDDMDVFNWIADCDEYKSKREYPDMPLSEEEANFPVAYIITTHKESAQLERLLRAIFQPQNIYCIHPDLKSTQLFHNTINKLSACFNNVFVASKLENVQYAGYERLLADINCMRDLLARPEPWRYVMNMCAQDFPLKTNLEIIRQLKMYKGHNDINGILPPPYIKWRTQFKYRNTLRGKLIRTSKKKTAPPHGLTVYFGNAYYAATHRFVNFVVKNEIAIDLLKWSNDTYSPDEHYWVTLQRANGTPGGYQTSTWDENIRFMKWADIPRHPACKGKYVRALCVFGVGYMEYLTRQPHLFANKFYYSFDPVTLQCIEELLDYRIAHPNVINVIENFPIVDMVWQNDNTKPGV